MHKRLTVEVTELEEKFKKLEQTEKKRSADSQEESDLLETGLYLRQKKGFLEEFDLLENGYKAAQILFRDTSSADHNFGPETPPEGEGGEQAGGGEEDGGDQEGGGDDNEGDGDDDSGSGSDGDDSGDSD